MHIYDNAMSRWRDSRAYDIARLESRFIITPSADGILQGSQKLA